MTQTQDKGALTSANNSQLDTMMHVRVMMPADMGMGDELIRVDGASIQPIVVAQYIRALRQNWRQGTVACKGRSEVAHSGRKPWKQKGTGRARAGDACSPLWRGGGVIFGPQPRVRKLDVPMAMRRLVLRNLFQQALVEGRILLCDNPFADRPSARIAARLIQATGVTCKHFIFFTALDDGIVHASFANMPHVSLLLFDQSNGYVLLRGRYWLLLHKDLDMFKRMVQTWI